MKYMTCKCLLVPIVFIIGICTVYGQNDSVQQDDAFSLNTAVEKILSVFEYDVGRVSVNVYPSVGADPASGVSFGIMPVVIIAPKNPTEYSQSATLVNFLAYSTRNWLNLKIDGLVYTKSGDEIKGVWNYVSAPDHFYGIKQTERNYNPEEFNFRENKLRGSYSKKLPANMFAGLLADISHVSVDGLSDFEQKNTFLMGLGPILSYDTRNHVNYPSKGSFVSAGFLHFPKLSEQNYSFRSVEFDARHFISVYKDYILAGNFYSAASYGDIPFYYLPQLGGRSRMRGISNKFMYINTHVTYVQAEMRKHVWGRFGVVAFGAAGNAYSSLRTVSMEHNKFVYGVGLRFLTSEDEKLNLRIDYGRGSSNDSGVYIVMREVF